MIELLRFKNKYDGFRKDEYLFLSKQLTVQKKSLKNKTHFFKNKSFRVFLVIQENFKPFYFQNFREFDVMSLASKVMVTTIVVFNKNV